MQDEPQEKFIQLAPKVLALASEVQLVLGLYEVLSSALKGDRVNVYKTILTIVRSKLTPVQCVELMKYMQTAITALEFAEKVREILTQIIEHYNSNMNETSLQTREIITRELTLDEILSHSAFTIDNISI